MSKLLDCVPYPLNTNDPALTIRANMAQSARLESVLRIYITQRASRLAKSAFNHKFGYGLELNVGAAYQMWQEAREALRRLEFVDRGQLLLDEHEWHQRVIEVKDAVAVLEDCYKAAQQLNAQVKDLKDQAEDKATDFYGRCQQVTDGEGGLQELFQAWTDLERYMQSVYERARDIVDFKNEWDKMQAALNRVCLITPPTPPTK